MQSDKIQKYQDLLDRAQTLYDQLNLHVMSDLSIDGHLSAPKIAHSIQDWLMMDGLAVFRYVYNSGK